MAKARHDKVLTLNLIVLTHNYVLKFLKDISQLYALLRQRLEKNRIPWNEEHTKIVKTVKSRVKPLSCLALTNPEAFKIIETDTLGKDYGVILN